MNTKLIKQQRWPFLPYSEWKDTLDTLHMWMQIVGKVKVKLCPFLNQWWEVAFSITENGMTTGLIPYEDRAFSAYFDFLHHTLTIRTSTDQSKIIQLKSYSVAVFYKEFMQALKELN